MRNPNLQIDNKKKSVALPTDAAALDEEYVEYDFQQHKKDTQRIYAMQKRLQSEGDFIRLNKLQITSGGHDQINRLKSRVVNTVSNSRRSQIHQRKEEGVMENLKYKVFLQHRKDIMHKIKKQMLEQSLQKYEAVLRIRWWILILRNYYNILKAFDNLKVKKEKIQFHTWQVAACKQIRRRFQLALQRFGSTIDVRKQKYIKMNFTLFGMTFVPVLQHHPHKAIYYFLKDSADYQYSKRCWMSFCETIYRLHDLGYDSLELAKKKKMALYRQLLDLKLIIMNEMLKNKDHVKLKGGKRLSKAQINLEKEKYNEKTKKYINIKEDTMKQLSNQFFKMKRVRYHIVDYYAMLQTSVRVQDELNKLIAEKEAERALKEQDSPIKEESQEGSAQQESVDGTSVESGERKPVDFFDPAEIEKRQKKLEMQKRNIDFYHKKIPQLLSQYE